MMHWRYGMFGGWLGTIVMIAFCAIVLYAIIRLIANPTFIGRNTDDSLKILNERFAKGELGEEEYRQRRDIIKKP